MTPHDTHTPPADSTEPLNLAIIWGSGRPNGRGVKVASWVQSNLPEGWSTDVIALSEHPLPSSLAIDTEELRATVADLSTRLAAADAFLFVFPEFNHSLPGAVKIFLDSFYSEWRAKAAGLVTYGGLSGGIRAAETFRTIAGELHLHVVRDGVIFPKAGEVFSEGSEHPLKDVNVGALHSMMGQLAWWARALRTARNHTPYA